MMFHNSRIFLLVILLVAAGSSPQAQAIVFTLSALLGISWDLTLLPYDGRLLFAETLALSAGKIIGGAAYIALTVPDISTDACTGLSTFIVVILVLSILTGFGLTVAQIVIAVRTKLGEKSWKEDVEKFNAVAEASAMSPGNFRRHGESELTVAPGELPATQRPALGEKLERQGSSPEGTFRQEQPQEQSPQQPQ